MGSDWITPRDALNRFIAAGIDEKNAQEVLVNRWRSALMPVSAGRRTSYIDRRSGIQSSFRRPAPFHERAEVEWHPQGKLDWEKGDYEVGSRDGTCIVYADVRFPRSAVESLAPTPDPTEEKLPTKRGAPPDQIRTRAIAMVAIQLYRMSDPELGALSNARVIDLILNQYKGHGKPVAPESQKSTASAILSEVRKQRGL